MIGFSLISLCHSDPEHSGDSKYYVRELLYKSRMTNSDLIEFFKKNNISKDRYIYADSSEPGRIEELRRNGYLIIPAEKDVTAGIDFVKGCSIYTLAANVNFNEEISGYCWKKDKNGLPVDYPEKGNDHSMDAMRYAIYTRYKTYTDVQVFWL